MNGNISLALHALAGKTLKLHKKTGNFRTKKKKKVKILSVTCLSENIVKILYPVNILIRMKRGIM